MQKHRPKPSIRNFLTPFIKHSMFYLVIFFFFTVSSIRVQIPPKRKEGAIYLLEGRGLREGRGGGEGKEEGTERGREQNMRTMRHSHLK